jgi:hypothetical protein
MTVRPVATTVDDPENHAVWLRDGGSCCIFKTQKAVLFASIVPPALLKDPDMSKGVCTTTLSRFLDLLFTYNH